MKVIRIHVISIIPALQKERNKDFVRLKQQKTKN